MTVSHAQTMKTLLAALVVIGLSAGTLVSAAQCGQGSEKAGSGVRSEMLVSTEWLAQHLRDPDLIMLCIATSSEYCDNGRIPGARFIGLGTIAVTRDGVPNELPPVDALQHVFETAGMSNDSRVVIYGERYGLFAARAYYTLDYMGVADHAALLNGGLEKWKAEGRALAAGLSEVSRGKLSVNLKPGILIELNDMQKLAENPQQSAIIDARPEDEFSGAKLSEEVGIAGHIPHASGLYWMRLLESPANPVLRPENELRELFDHTGAKDHGKVITYCRSGMQSSYDYFVAKYLGYNAAMYDESFYEWSRKGLPVESADKK